jgi:hypothetical protein
MFSFTGSHGRRTFVFDQPSIVRKLQISKRVICNLLTERGLAVGRAAGGGSATGGGIGSAVGRPDRVEGLAAVEPLDQVEGSARRSVEGRGLHRLACRSRPGRSVEALDQVEGRRVEGLAVGRGSRAGDGRGPPAPPARPARDVGPGRGAGGRGLAGRGAPPARPWSRPGLLTGPARPGDGRGLGLLTGPAWRSRDSTGSAHRLADLHRPNGSPARPGLAVARLTGSACPPARLGRLTGSASVQGWRSVEGSTGSAGSPRPGRLKLGHKINHRGGVWWPVEPGPSMSLIPPCLGSLGSDRLAGILEMTSTSIDLMMIINIQLLTY